ncbi:LuxR C-terminal-related transcriptional regulator [Georgenia sp. TF02-10]|uniref:LuxR family transcriptional regulator n=1 Tax=Georgenia sp. TF02-10 TaxID=2917725 RepID=UPI001FA71ADA|nr:LuxR family transcriptional regulator [Georgenia sp. TF02-10]UNX54345.1 LuxR C-terminal-related transcriptional regulator [Georgenia sp. TF02-10]
MDVSLIKAGAARPRRAPEVVVDERLTELLDLAAPLTVIRGPRGFGKTTLLQTWLAAGGPAHPVVQLALTRAANAPEVFWSTLLAVLVDAGAVPAPDRPAAEADGRPGPDARHEVLTGLGRRAEPLTVVVDDYHQAGRGEDAADIDEDLVELVRQNDQLFLVVATRGARVIETTGALSVDITIISPRELRLRPQHVRTLAGRLGVPLAEREAERLADGLDGWPAAVRDVLVRSRGGPVNLSLADDYIAAVVRDLRDEHLRDFVLRTAVPEEFDAELVRRVVPGEEALVALRAVRSGGMVREEVRGERRVYAYPPLVRQALLRLLDETRPEVRREVHRALVDIHERSGDHLGVLRHAVQGGAWPVAERVIETEWHHLITTDPATLVGAAQRMPRELVDRHPRLRVARDELTGALRPRPDRPPAPAWTTGDIPGITLELGLDRMGSPIDPTVVVLLQWGGAAVLAGDESAALYAFGRARARAQASGTDPLGVRLATAGLALAHAIYADADLAATWLADPALADAADAADYPLLESWVALAAATVAVDRLQPDAAALVAAIPERERRDEVWAFGVFVGSAHAALSRDPAEAVRWAEKLRAARHYLPGDRLVEDLLLAAEVEVLLAAGLDAAARRSARRLAPSAISLPTHARLSLAAGDYAQAAGRAQGALDHPGLTVRSVMECHLVLAAARHALGERAGAHAAFADAVRVADASGQRRPFLILPYSTFRALAGGEDRVVQMWPPALRPGNDDAVGPRGGLAAVLTRREAETLRALARHSGAVAVAGELGLSVNTVKSHLRSVYHKLGVTTRSEALARAAEIDAAGDGVPSGVGPGTGDAPGAGDGARPGNGGRSGNGVASGDGGASGDGVAPARDVPAAVAQSSTGQGAPRSAAR